MAPSSPRDSLAGLAGTGLGFKRSQLTLVLRCTTGQRWEADSEAESTRREPERQPNAGAACASQGGASASAPLPEGPREDNALDAMTAGATRGVTIAANIGGCLVSFLAVQAMLDAAVSWWFGLVGLPHVDLQFLLGKLLWVVAWLMGVEYGDCEAVGRLVAVKTLANEFVAYLQLVQLQDSVSPRSVAIATYALCGFSNLGSVGIQLATLGVLAPDRRQELTRMAWGTLASGFLACCLTACLASLLLEDGSL